MAITGPQLLQDAGGELSRETFPTMVPAPATLDAQLIVWADAGNAKATACGLAASVIDDAALCWAYYLAYMSVFQRLAAAPQSTKLEGQGEVRMDSAKQAYIFKDMADIKKDCFEDMCAGEPVVEDNTPTGTVSVPLKSVWG